MRFKTHQEHMIDLYKKDLKIKALDYQNLLSFEGPATLYLMYTRKELLQTILKNADKGRGNEKEDTATHLITYCCDDIVELYLKDNILFQAYGPNHDRYSISKSDWTTIIKVSTVLKTQEEVSPRIIPISKAKELMRVFNLLGNKCRQSFIIPHEHFLDHSAFLVPRVA